MATEKNSIFDLADQLDYQSPFGNWQATDFKAKSSVYTPVVITNMTVNPYDAYAESPMRITPLVYGYKPSYVKADENVVKVTVKVTVFTSTKAKYVDVALKGGKTVRANMSLNAMAYEAVFELSVYKSKARIDGYMETDFTFIATVTDVATESISDTQTLVVTVDTGGNLKNTIILSKTETIEFHVYSSGLVEKWVPKNYDDKATKGKMKYVYHDIEGKKHDIATVNFHYTEKRKNGCKTVDCSKNGATITSIPDNYIKTYKYPSGGNAQNAYVYDNGEIYVDGTEYGIRKYPQDKGFVQLVRMPDSLDIEEANFKMIYAFSGSQRRYCNPESFAGFIGALAELSRKVSCTGMCFEDATSYPSVSHPNGDSVDTGYYKTLEEEQKKVDAFFKFHFRNIYRGKTGWYDELKNSSFKPQHEDHLHAGEFDSSKVVLKVV